MASEATRMTVEGNMHMVLNVFEVYNSKSIVHLDLIISSL